jgi:translation initiation factor 2 alpha subunit (eIF-2alpha)
MPQSNFIAGAGGVLARFALDSLSSVTETKTQKEERWKQEHAERKQTETTKRRGGTEAEKAQRQFRRRARREFKSVEEAFGHFDRKDRGYLSHTDFKQVARPNTTIIRCQAK